MRRHAKARGRVNVQWTCRQPRQASKSTQFRLPPALPRRETVRVQENVCSDGHGYALQQIFQGFCFHDRQLPKSWLVKTRLSSDSLAHSIPSLCCTIAQGILKNADLIPKIYGEGWTMRVYHSVTKRRFPKVHQVLCQTQCLYPHLDLCHVDAVPGWEFVASESFNPCVSDLVVEHLVCIWQAQGLITGISIHIIALYSLWGIRDDFCQTALWNGSRCRCPRLWLFVVVCWRYDSDI